MQLTIDWHEHVLNLIILPSKYARGYVHTLPRKNAKFGKCFKDQLLSACQGSKMKIFKLTYCKAICQNLEAKR